MANVLTNPDGFFSKLSPRDTKLTIPFIIVLVAAIIAAISSAMMVSAITSALPAEAAPFAAIGAAVGAIGGLIMQFIMWLLYAGVFYVISMLFGGEGSFKRVFEFVGYGFIPTIIAAIIGLAVFTTVLPTIEFSVEDPQLFQQTFMQDPLMQASGIIGILLMLWSANIWIFGIKHARNITTKNALITVGVPVGLYLLYSSYMMYKMGI